MITYMKEYLLWFYNNIKNRKGIRVFCCHGVVENAVDTRLERNLYSLSDFKSYINFLKRFRVLALSELLEVLKSPHQRPIPGAVITFDDGYANNLLAGELLAEARLPWSVFVSTGALGRHNCIWTVELSLLLLQGRAEKVEALGRIWPLTNRQERGNSFQGIRYPLKAMPAQLKQETMAMIRAQFPHEETKRLLHEFPSLKMLTWEEVGQLAQAGVEVGSHGVNHEIHHGDQPASIRRRELTESKAELEQRLGSPCRFFSFPNGDFNAASAAEVRAAGYEIGLTLEPRPILPGENPYLLPRLFKDGKSPSLAKSIYNFFRI
jgi:peptidoglycan/xylan/chitin deacetylase (PgdA/CDA1 family)